MAFGRFRAAWAKNCCCASRCLISWGLEDKNCAARRAAHVRSALQRADFCAEIGNAFQPVRDAFLEAAKLVNDI